MRNQKGMTLIELTMVISVATLAVVGALFLPGPAAFRLGLQRGRLPALQVSVLVVGMLALSHAVTALLELTQAIGESALPAMPEFTTM